MGDRSTVHLNSTLIGAAGTLVHQIIVNESFSVGFINVEWSSTLVQGQGSKRRTVQRGQGAVAVKVSIVEWRILYKSWILSIIFTETNFSFSNKR